MLLFKFGTLQGQESGGPDHDDALLIETDDALLLETGDFILLETA